MGKTAETSTKNLLFPEVLLLPKAEKLAVLIPPDRLHAYLFCLPAVFPPSYSARSVIERIHELGIRALVDAEAVRRFTEECARGRRPPPVEIAAGIAPQCGPEGGWIYSFPKVEEPEALTRLPNYFRAGQTIAQRAPGGGGKEGKDVWGEPLAPPPSELPPTGEGLQIDGESLVAERDGFLVQLEDGTVTLLPNCRIPGTVLLVYSPLAIVGGVAISGSIPPRAVLQVEGDLQVRGNVHRGAKIQAGGSVVIEGEILRASIKARGNIVCKAATKATLHAEGNIKVLRRFSGGAAICTNGCFTADDGSVIENCVIEALRGVDIWNCGTSERGKSTIAVGLTQAVERQMASVEEEIRRLSTQREKVLDAFSRAYGHMEEATAKRSLSKEERARLNREREVVVKRQEEIDRRIASLKGRRNELDSKRKRCVEAVIRVRNRAWPVVHFWVRKRLLVQTTPLDGPLVVVEGPDHRLHVEPEVNPSGASDGCVTSDPS